MLVGILGFIMAALVVSAYGPETGFSTSLGWLPPIVYVAAFHLAQRTMARYGRDLVISQAARGEAGVRSRPFLLVLLQVLGLLATLHLGWSRYVQETLGLGDLWLAPALLLFLPFFLVHVSWLAARREVKEALESDPWPLPSYLAFHIRILVLPTLPCLVFSSLNFAASRPTTGNLLAAFPSLELLAGLLTAAVIVIFSPFFMRLALRSRPLEPGPLRRSLDEVAREGRFEFLDIRVAETHDRIINALFVGVLGRMRYVFLTDAIMKKLSVEDLRGVFAHEMAHSKRGHILLNMALMLGFSLMLQVLGSGGFGDDEGWFVGLLGLLALPLFFLLVFAPLMRTWETEADVYSGEILGDPGPIKRSLAELGRLHPKRMREGGLTHPSIEQRLAFIDTYFKDGAVRTAFGQRVKRLRRSVYLFFFLPLLVWALTLPLELAEGTIRRDIQLAQEAEDATLAGAALERLEERLGQGLDDPGYRMRAQLWTIQAAAYQKAEDFAAAEPALRRMKEHLDDFDGPIPIYNAAVLEAQQEAGQGRIARMLAPLRQAEDALKPIVELVGADHEEVVRERKDLAFMRGLEELARRLGRLPPAVTPGPLPASDRPEDRALAELARRAAEGPIEAADVASLTADLERGWKRAALLALGPSESPGERH